MRSRNPTSKIDSSVSGRTSAEGGFAFRARVGCAIEVFVVAEQEQEGRFWYADWRGTPSESSPRTELDLVLERGTPLNGRVEDHAGSPIPAFRLQWNAQTASGLRSEAGEEYFTTTDGSCVVFVPHGGAVVPQATEVLHSRFSSPYGVPDEVLTVSEADEGFVLHVHQVSVVSGLVVDATGRLLKHVPVELHWESGQSDAERHRNQGSSGRLTDAEGAFEFAQSIPESDVRVFVAGEPGTLIEIRISPGEVRKDLVIYL